MKFDAYAGNVWDGRLEQVAELVAHRTRSRVERARPRSRYGAVLELFDGAAPIGWVADDPVNGSAYFEFKGVRTPDVAAALQADLAPGSFNVSRADVCEDFDEPGAHKRLVALVDATKRDDRVESLAMTPRNGDKGETIYWGSPKSAMRVRCYEKGKQKENLHLGRPNWARLEAQVRPSKSVQKALAASLSPVAMWGFASWSKNVAEAITGLELTRYAPPQAAPEFDRTTLYLARTFQRHLREMLEDFGSWECVGREIEAIWLQDEKTKRGLGQ